MALIADNLTKSFEKGIYASSKKGFLEKNSVDLNFIVSRTKEEKMTVKCLHEELKSLGWDYESFCIKKGYKFNEQINIFARKEKMEVCDYLEVLFESDCLNIPLVYDGEVVKKNKRAYYPIYTVWAADLNSSAASSQIGDVEQIVFEFEEKNEKLIPLRMSKKSHYYPNCSEIKSNNIWWAFGIGNHFPYIADGKKVSNETAMNIKNKNHDIGSFKGKDFYALNFEKPRGTLKKSDFFSEKISRKISRINKEIKVPFFEKNWSYINPELMFSPKGRLLGCIDAIVYTF